MSCFHGSVLRKQCGSMSEVVRHRERFPQLIARRCRPLDAIEATNTLPPCWTDPGACEREQVCRKYLGPKNPEGKTHAPSGSVIRRGRYSKQSLFNLAMHLERSCQCTQFLETSPVQLPLSSLPRLQPMSPINSSAQLQATDKRLVLDLFDRRWEVVQELRSAIAEMMRSGVVQTKIIGTMSGRPNEPRFSLVPKSPIIWKPSERP